VSARLLILRPEPGASATAALAQARGVGTVVAPLFSVRPLAWETPPAAAFDAVVLSSANATRHGGASLRDFHGLPLYAVGAATAAAARDIGFRDVRAGTADAAALMTLAAAEGRRGILHLAGREHRPLTQAGVEVTTRLVYASEAVAVLPAAAREALAEGAIALLHSPRAARLFRTLAEAAGLRAAFIHVAAISPAALIAAGEGWAQSAVAAAPTDAALLDAALRLCDQRAREDG
jgi:uroporphyrinogen-III synthase